MNESTDAELSKLLAQSQTDMDKLLADLKGLASTCDAEMREPLRGEDSKFEPVPLPNPNLTAADVAKWMLQELQTYGVLHQEQAAHHIQMYFGERFVYINRNGNLAISQNVLSEFMMLTQHKVVWNRRKRFWRDRLPEDPPDSRKVDN